MLESLLSSVRIQKYVSGGRNEDNIYKRKKKENLWASLIAQLVKNLPASRRPWFDSWVGKILWRKDRLPTSVFLGLPCGSAGKKSAFNVGDLCSIPGLGRYPGEEKGYPLQYSGLENSMGYIVHGVTNSWTCWATFTSLYKKQLGIIYQTFKSVYLLILNSTSEILSYRYLY